MMNTKKTIPIFFSSDDNYLPFMAVAIRSLIDNASSEYAYCIHILNNGLNERRLAPILAMQSDNVQIRPVDVTSVIAPIAERLNLRDYYTVSIYFRLFIASMFPQYHKAIYLDADIAINGDISKLYEIPLGNRILGVVSDDIIASHPDFRRYAEEAVGVTYRRYFNSGVLLMNLDAFRLCDIERKFVYLLQKYHFETVCPDQDYLNVLCRGKVLYLDKGWNKMSIDRDYDGVPSIVHYNMFYKPWQYRHICYQEYFWKYAERTPFYAELREMQKSFGIKGRMGHYFANRTLHKNALRIAAMPNNFQRVMRGVSPDPKHLYYDEVAYEA